MWRLSPGIVLEDSLIPMHAESRRCLSSEKLLVSEHRNIPFRRVNRQLSAARIRKSASSGWIEFSTRLPSVSTPSVRPRLINIRELENFVERA